jgi:ATP-dependent DNA ligase
MQCKPVAALPAGEKWVFELKLDGYRCIAAKRGKRSRYLALQEGAHQSGSQVW